MAPRFALLGLLVGLAGVAYAQDDPISYRTGAIPASRALDELSKLTNRKLRVDAPLDTEPLILNLQSVELKDVLPRISEALHGFWSDDGYVKTLRRRKYDISTLGRQDALLRARLIQAAIHSRDATTKEPYWTQQQAATALKTFQARSPDQLLIDRVLAGLNASEIATAPYPDHIVYATRPRPMQYTLRLSPADINAIFDEQNAWTKAFQANPKKHPNVARRLIDPTRCRILAVCSDDRFGMPAWISVRIVDGDETACVRAEAAFPKPPPGEDIPVTTTARPFELDPLSKGFISSMVAGAPASSNLLAALQHPAKEDPLDFVISDGLLKMSDSGHFDLVASPPDDSLFDPSLASLAKSEMIDPATFLRLLQDNCKVEMQGQTMIVSPTAPLRAADRRTDRTAMEAYFQKLGHEGFSSTDAETEFAVANPGSDLDLVRWWAKHAYPSANPFLGSSMLMLKFYGSLSVPQRQTLMNGITLRLDDLTATQKALLGPMIVDEPADLFVGRYPEKPIYKPGLDLTEILDQFYEPSLSIDLSAQPEKDLLITATDSLGKPETFVVSADLAPDLLSQDGPWQSLSYMAGTSNALRFDIQVNPRVKLAETLREFPTSFTKRPLQTLPPAIRAGIPPDPALQTPGAKGKPKSS